LSLRHISCYRFFGALAPRERTAWSVIEDSVKSLQYVEVKLITLEKLCFSSQALRPPSGDPNPAAHWFSAQASNLSQILCRLSPSLTPRLVYHYLTGYDLPPPRDYQLGIMLFVAQKPRGNTLCSVSQAYVRSVCTVAYDSRWNRINRREDQSPRSQSTFKSLICKPAV